MYSGRRNGISAARLNLSGFIPPTSNTKPATTEGTEEYGGNSSHHRGCRFAVECCTLFSMPKKLSHYDSDGRARMVDVSAKARTAREAEASALVLMSPDVLRALPSNPKGDPLEVARTAGIMAAKRTSELIPMCHPVPLTHIAVTLSVCENGVAIRSKVKTTAVTGVEMEALVAASVAALTVYDMCKALDKGIEIREVVLEKKSGGKSGDYRRRAPRK
jgi:cyclic pyranopterin monophosphate synthase